MKFDIVFMSYFEPEADANYKNLLNLRPQAKHVRGVKGIGNAHKNAASVAETNHFFIIDADNWVFEYFKFDIQMEQDIPDIALWRTVNAVNGLVWFNGGIKLVSKTAIESLDLNGTDFFATMKGSRWFSDVAASENRFNATPYTAFRTAFRECSKLSSGLLKVANAGSLLDIWCNVGADKKNGIWCLKGGRAGYFFGRTKGNSSGLNRINDDDFIAFVFKKNGGHL